MSQVFVVIYGIPLFSQKKIDLPGFMIFNNFKIPSTEIANSSIGGIGSRYKAAHHQPYPGVLLCSAVRETGVLSS